MTFENFKIFSSREIEEIRQHAFRATAALPSRFQIGQSVKLWVWEPPESSAVPEALVGVVVRVSFGTVDPGNGVAYAVAFKLVGGPWWGVVEDVRGSLTDVEQHEFTPGEDLVEITPEFKAGLRRASFEAILGGASSDSESASKASLSLVSPPAPE